MKAHSSNQRLVALFKKIEKGDKAALKTSPEQVSRMAPIYDRHGIETEDGPDELVKEICLDGANTFMSVIRGWKGVPYQEVVRDVAEKVDATVGEKSSEIKMERAILDRVIAEYFEQHGKDTDFGDVAEILKTHGASVDDVRKRVVAGGWTAGTLGLLINSIGERAVAKLVQEIVLAIIGKQAARAAALQAARFASFAIPMLNAVMVGWQIVDIAGPAFRKTVPTVLEVAILRMEHGSTPKKKKKKRARQRKKRT